MADTELPAALGSATGISSYKHYHAGLSTTKTLSILVVLSPALHLIRVSEALYALEMSISLFKHLE